MHTRRHERYRHDRTSRSAWGKLRAVACVALQIKAEGGPRLSQMGLLSSAADEPGPAGVSEGAGGEIVWIEFSTLGSDVGAGRMQKSCGGGGGRVPSGRGGLGKRGHLQNRRNARGAHHLDDADAQPRGGELVRCRARRGAQLRRRARGGVASPPCCGARPVMSLQALSSIHALELRGSTRHQRGLSAGAARRWLQ